MLFHQDLYLIESTGSMKHRNRELVRRFDIINQQVYAVSNEVTVFLIRSHR